MTTELKHCDNCTLVFSAKKGQRFCSDGCRFDFHNAVRMEANKSRDYITPEVKGYFQNIQILEKLINLKLQGPFTKEQLEKMNFQFDSLISDKITKQELQITFFDKFKLTYNVSLEYYTVGIMRSKYYSTRVPRGN
jgi:hypothetical protein